MIRIFIDANILFSATMKGGATRILFDAAIRHADECITNLHAFEEARRNIQAKRPDRLPELADLCKHLSISNAFFSGLEIELPLQDIPILAGAIGANCTHLWTGDKRHFGKWYGKSVHGVRVVSGVMLADILLAAGWGYRPAGDQR